jgi:hypothetical protein
VTTTISAEQDARFIAPASDNDMAREYWEYAKGLLIRCGVARDAADDATQDVFAKIIQRGMRSKYDPDHTVEHQGTVKRCTFKAYFSGIVALYARGIREANQARAKREVFLFDMPDPDDGGTPAWAEALAGKWLDDYPSLADSEFVDRIRTWLALQPPEARWVPATGERELGGSDLLALFDDLAAETAGPRRSRKAKQAWAALQASLRAAGGRAAPDASWDIGGVSVSPESLNEAVRVLEASSSIMVHAPLRAAGHPLADAPDRRWYHEFSAEERILFPELEIDPSTHKRPAGHVKIAVLHRMRRMLAEASVAGEGNVSATQQRPARCEAGAATEAAEPGEPQPWERIEAVLWELGATANVVDMCQGWAAEGGMAVPA